MKVGIDVHTIGKQQTGNETYIRNLVNHLLLKYQDDTDYHLFYTHEDTFPDYPLESQTRISPPQSIFRIPFVFPYQLHKQHIDVAHFQYVIPPYTKVPTVVMIHDISYEYHPEYFDRMECQRMKLLIPYSARKSNHILTVSEYSKQCIIEKYGVPEKKITVTYNGVSDRFRVIHNKHLLDQQLSRFNLENPFILAVGNLQPRKNIERLIRAYAQLKAAGKISHDLVIVGQMRWGGESIFSEIEQLGLKHNIYITGYVDDDELVALYNQADVFVYPSLYEGFGLPLIEAMACGTAVISSSASCLPEIGADAVWYIDPYSESDIAAAIETLTNSPVKRQPQIDKGLQRVKDFHWNTTAQITQQIFKEVAASC